jgi:hypothetical protein
MKILIVACLIRLSIFHINVYHVHIFNRHLVEGRLEERKYDQITSRLLFMRWKLKRNRFSTELPLTKKDISHHFILPLVNMRIVDLDRGLVNINPEHTFCEGVYRHDRPMARLPHKVSPPNHRSSQFLVPLFQTPPTHLSFRSRLISNFPRLQNRVKRESRLILQILNLNGILSLEM